MRLKHGREQCSMRDISLFHHCPIAIAICRRRHSNCIVAIKACCTFSPRCLFGINPSSIRFTCLLAFPGLFRGALDARARVINDAMKLAAAERLASLVTEQEFEEGQIIPQAMNYDVAPALAAAVAQAAMDSGVARVRVDPQAVARHCHDFIYEGILTPVPILEEIQK